MAWLVEFCWLNFVGPYSSMAHEVTTFKIAEKRARRTSKRHRRVDEEGRTLDIIDP
jgi:membrane protein required for beta-lactamase induction